MDINVLLLFAILTAYFIGALPTAAIIARRIGHMNILEHGSGNPGASNMYRIFGARWATATLIVDVFKGYLPVWLSERVASQMIHPIFAQNEIAVMGWIAAAAFFGHVYSPFLKFKGGKGAATGLGAMFALAPQATMLTLIVYGGTLYLWKRFAVATLVGALAFPILIYFREGGQQTEAFFWGLAVPILLVFTHRSNISRILRDEELPMSSANGENEEG
jgi:acyl phosphate:glycerol-3-phosphate acyltransferase